MAKQTTTVNAARVALGQTEDSRYLMVVFTIPKLGKAKVITARDMNNRERRLYKRKRR